MHKLGFTDASFLHLERNGAPMSIASVQHFTVPTADFDISAYFQRLKRYLAARVHGIPFMTRRLKRTPFDLDQPVWVTDPDFDINCHVFRTRLPAPGTDRQLATLIAHLHEQPLDRSRPLWEMHLIDGLTDDTFVLYNKYHHAAIDGVSGQQILNVLYSDSPDSSPQPAARTRADLAENGELVFNAMMNLTLQPLEQLARMGERMRAASRIAALLRNAPDDAATASAPATPFAVRVSPYRNFATTSLPLNQMRLLGKRVGASVNDVLLAVCADGLRRYLERHDALPAAPLLAGIPVSLRSHGDRSFNNKVAMLRASMATDVEGPAERLVAISRSTRAGKELLNEARALIPDDVHMPGLSWMLQSAVNVADRLNLGNVLTPACNVIISNVPGPRKTRYLLGAEMLTHHPVSIAADGNALNITVQSYKGRLDLGITACLEAVPDVEALRDDLDAGWEALVAACEPGRLQIAA
ncbi:MAG: wax ester/triacylglycerol synthase family O-acyltransferase [Pseudomonadales bacterium]